MQHCAVRSRLTAVANQAIRWDDTTSDGLVGRNGSAACTLGGSARSSGQVREDSSATWARRGEADDAATAGH